MAAPAKSPSTGKQIIDVLAAANKTIVTAESCTGGMIAAALTDIPGSSALPAPMAEARKSPLASSMSRYHRNSPPSSSNTNSVTSAATASAKPASARHWTWCYRY